MEDSVGTLLYETYKFAYKMAKKAESAYLFECRPQTTPFIKFDYWECVNDGLQSEDCSYVSLKLFEAAYQEKRGYDFKVIKAISVRKIERIALLKFGETGTYKT